MIVSETIAYCGLNCSECKAYKATQTADSEWKKQIAQHWTEGLNVNFEPEEVDCNGCKSDRISGWCRKICKIRPCAQEKNVKTCADCNDYPCAMLKDFLSNEEPAARQNLQKIQETLHH